MLLKQSLSYSTSVRVPVRSTTPRIGSHQTSHLTSKRTVVILFFLEKGEYVSDPAWCAQRERSASIDPAAMACACMHGRCRGGCTGAPGRCRLRGCAWPNKLKGGLGAGRVMGWMDGRGRAATAPRRPATLPLPCQASSCSSGCGWTSRAVAEGA